MKAELTKQLRRDEGEVLYAYPDSLSYLTIGIGRLIDRRKGGGITAEESAYLLNNDIDRKTAELLQRAPWIASLDPARRGCLVNMAFQLGLAGLAGFPKMLASLRDEKFEEAETHALDSLWAKQTPARAKRMAEQMRTGQWVFA